MKKKPLVIDAHSHYVPGEVAGENNSNISRKFPEAIFKRSCDIRLAVEHMDIVGIDIAVINTASRSHLGADECKAINNGYARVLRDYPERFIPCAHVFPREARSAINELERAIGGLGLRGVAFPTSMPGLTLDSQEMWPIYEKISELDVPIVIHPTSRQPLWGGENYRIGITISKEYDIAKATCEVMFGVLPHFPDLKFLMPHYGGGMPVLKARVLSHYEPEGWKVPEALVDVAKSQRQVKELGLAEDFEKNFNKLYFDTAGYTEYMPVMEAAIQSIKTERLCFGTDYPFQMAAPEDRHTFLERVKGLKISEADRRLILGENIKSLFKL